MLADNPILAQNPQCLGDFIKAILQPTVETVATPMAVDRPASKIATAPDPSEESLAARKAYWAKYKRPVLKGSEASLDSSLSKSTLVLGEEPRSTVAADDYGFGVVDVAPLSFPSQAAGDAAGDASGDKPENAEPEAFEADLLKEIEALDFVGPNKNNDGGDTPDLQSPVEVSKPNNQCAVDPAPERAEEDKHVQACELEANRLRERFMKLDTKQLEKEIDKAKTHPFFPMFATREKCDLEHFGKRNDVDELVYFYTQYFAEGIESGHVEEPPQPPVVDPSHASPPAMTEPNGQLPADPTSPEDVPMPARGESAVASALKRISTVDLANGCRPPQTLIPSQHEPPKTVVLMTFNGVTEPFALPLTPAQCIAAGLQLAHPPHDDHASEPAVPPVPAAASAVAQPVPPVPVAASAVARPAPPAPVAASPVPAVSAAPPVVPPKAEADDEAYGDQTKQFQRFKV